MTGESYNCRPLSRMTTGTLSSGLLSANATGFSAMTTISQSIRFGWPVSMAATRTLRVNGETVAP